MNITFLLDENIPYAFIDLLLRQGYMAIHLKKAGQQGIKNGEVYKIAEEKNMWIITRDADFQNLERFFSYNVAGILLFKVGITKTDYLKKTMKKFLDKYSDKLSEKHLIIIEDDGIKVY